MTGKLIAKLGTLLLLMTVFNTKQLAAQVAPLPSGATLSGATPSGPTPSAATADDDQASAITFRDLLRVDGQKVSLSDYKQHYVVVCFTSNTCPYSVDYEERLKQLQLRFQKDKRSAVVVAINSNDHKDDSMEEMVDRAKQQKFNFDYLKDADQSVAKAFDAVYTPEFFVLDQSRQIVYQGALDDSTNPKAATINHVLNAIESLRDGKPVEVSKTGARGCRIRFQRRRKQQ